MNSFEHTDISYIYGLFCPIKQKIMYVGKPVDPQVRLIKHLYPCELKKITKKANCLIFKK